MYYFGRLFSGTAGHPDPLQTHLNILAGYCLHFLAWQLRAAKAVFAA